MFETIMLYVIALAPTVFSIGAGLLVDYFRKRSIDKAVAAVEEARTKFAEFKDSNDVKELVSQIKFLTKALLDAKKAEILAVEELTHIHQLHPEWFDKED